MLLAFEVQVGQLATGGAAPWISLVGSLGAGGAALLMAYWFLQFLRWAMAEVKVQIEAENVRRKEIIDGFYVKLNAIEAQNRQALAQLAERLGQVEAGGDK